MTTDTPKPNRKRNAPRPDRPLVTVELHREFAALCAHEQIAPLDLLKDFIADLCDLRPWTAKSAYACNGEAAVRAARAYHATASQARHAKAKTRAAGVDVPTPQPAAEPRATTPIEALAAAVARDQKKDQP